MFRLDKIKSDEVTVNMLNLKSCLESAEMTVKTFESCQEHRPSGAF